MSLFDNLLEQIRDDAQLAETFAKCVDAMTDEQRARYEAVINERKGAVNE